jgi:UDP-N-acetylglucosamine 2-epimerase (non-hydrolysing)
MRWRTSLHIVSVVGTRPEAIKMAPLILALNRLPWLKHTLVLSGQHRSLLDQAFEQFGITADLDLNLMRENQRLGGLTGRTFIALEEAIDNLKPDLLLAQGDTTTVMVAAVSCFYQNVAFGHVEAGLRTGDLRYPFPEEFNRIVAGTVADMHFAPTPLAHDALLKAGVPADRIHTTGNTVIDALRLVEPNLPAAPVQLKDGEKLILLTAHRRENFGAPLQGVFSAIGQILQENPNVRLLYPVHPNPNVRQLAYDTFGSNPQVSLVEPLGYQEFISAMKAASFIVTDSGGVQEEAPALRKPVLVLRDETERPEAISFDVARLIGTDRERVYQEVRALLEDQSAYDAMASGASPYGDGLAVDRIIQAIAQRFGHDTGLPHVSAFNPRKA